MYVADQQPEQQIEYHDYNWHQNSVDHQKDANLVSAPIFNAYADYNSQATDYRVVCHFIQSDDKCDVDWQLGSADERDQIPIMQELSISAADGDLATPVVAVTAESAIIDAYPAVPNSAREVSADRSVDDIIYGVAIDAIPSDIDGVFADSAIIGTSPAGLLTTDSTSG
ncbi:OLC1v1018909C1 [Oldenlandia corymbosa var. corymbosa]|uniref:OLC1v1018909C1 n=1 Tax=Oldenlandia corymbosa var. corymbosa TaxID=529605 RepID=A0AAV1ECS2_OLDCO|nr:OLC1v1018909C1 [Oldenlandia corymbosa var. corymbosa]